MWASLLTTLESIANLTVVSTSSADVSLITAGFQRSRRSSRAAQHVPHQSSPRSLLAPGEEWWVAPNVLIARTLYDSLKAFNRSRSSAAAFLRTGRRTGPAEKRAWTTWAEAKVYLQAECYRHVLAAEGRSGARFDALAVLRADSVWLSPRASLAAMTHAALRVLETEAARQRAAGDGETHNPSRRGEIRRDRPQTGARGTVLIPDSDDGCGFNDRLAWMSRDAAPAYFGQYQFLQRSNQSALFRLQSRANATAMSTLRAITGASTGSGADASAAASANASEDFAGAATSEALLYTVLTAAAVRVLRVPTLSALGCCLASRSACWWNRCESYCLRTQQVSAPAGGDARFELKYEVEALVAMAHAEALEVGSARLIANRSACAHALPMYGTPRPRTQHQRHVYRKACTLTEPVEYGVCLLPQVGRPSADVLSPTLRTEASASLRMFEEWRNAYSCAARPPRRRSAPSALTFRELLQHGLRAMVTSALRALRTRLHGVFSLGV